MKTIPLTSKLLKELLNSSNLTARLFTNDLLNCEDYPSDIQFIETSFSGYSPKFLNPILCTFTGLYSVTWTRSI